MKVSSKSLKKYKNTFSGNGLEFIFLRKGPNSVERLIKILSDIDSDFIFPTDEKLKLDQYAVKLLNHAYNFILIDEEREIGVISIYANDQETKTAFASTIGILPSYRGRNLALQLVKFAMEFSKEVGMEKGRAEISKDNSKWLKFLLRQGFEIESETEHSYFIIKDLF